MGLVKDGFGGYRGLILAGFTLIKMAGRVVRIFNIPAAGAHETLRPSHFEEIFPEIFFFDEFFCELRQTDFGVFDSRFHGVTSSMICGFDETWKAFLPLSIYHSTRIHVYPFIAEVN